QFDRTKEKQRSRPRAKGELKRPYVLCDPLRARAYHTPPSREAWCGRLLIRGDHAVSPAGLRTVHGNVGPPQQFVDRVACLPLGYAETCSRLDRSRIRIDAHVAYRLAQLFCDGERIGKIMLCEEAKFLTAQTPADACASSQLRRDCNNHAIAEMMAVSVVHPLEMIDVEHDSRQLHASHRLPGDLLRAQEEFPAIEQAAERID